MKSDIKIDIIPIDGKYILTIIGGDRTISATFNSKEELRKRMEKIFYIINDEDKKSNELMDVSFNSLRL